MLKKIEQWIDQTNLDYSNRRISCICFAEDFSGFYPSTFLEKAYYVVTDVVPKPDIPGLREIGLGDFIDMRVDGITYKNTYYIVPQVAEDLRLHFHELVHVAQWRKLGAAGFIQRYIEEIQKYSYDGAPLEKMAYGLDSHYATRGRKMDVPEYVEERIYKY